MNDDQMVALLREVPLPIDPFDRYDAVSSRRRRADRRRLAVVGSALAVVALVGSVSAVTLQERASNTDIATLLSAQGDSADMEVVMTSADTKQRIVLRGVVDFAGDQMSYRAVSVIGPGTKGQVGHEFRKIGKDVWYRGLVVLPLPKGKLWVHSRHGVGGELSEFAPSRLFEQLRNAHADVQRVGTTSVDGVATTRYRITLHGDGPDTLFEGNSGELFVDDRGYVRRIHSSGADRVVTLTLSNFGRPVQVQPPDPSLVLESEDLSSGFGQTSSCPSATASPAAGVITKCIEVQQGTAPAQNTAQVCDQITSIPVDQNVTQARKDQLLEAFCKDAR